jgi:hypothetical protein
VASQYSRSSRGSLIPLSSIAERRGYGAEVKWYSSLKKDDKTLLKNYRPISLLRHIYKWISRVNRNRFARRLDDFQPPEQAGFQKRYSTLDHIHRRLKNNLPLCLAVVDYKKAFDLIEIWAVLQSL